MATKRLLRRPSLRVELLFRVAVGILAVGCASMAVGVLLLLRDVHSTSSSEDMELSTLGVGPAYLRANAETSTGSLHISSQTRSVEQIMLQCYKERDLGLVEVLRNSAREFCSDGGEVSSALLAGGSMGTKNTTTVTLFDAPGGVRATLFSTLAMDVSLSVASSSSNERDDKRFGFAPGLVQCQCPELEHYALTRQHEDGPLGLWSPTLANVPTQSDHPSTVCAADESQTDQAPPADLTIQDRVVLMARKNDQDPFAQISATLNAWVLMRMLGWSPANAQLVHLDQGPVTPMDTLHERLLSPRRPIIKGKELRGKRVQFASSVLLPPFESEGALMADLQAEKNPCFSSELLLEFRHVSLGVMHVAEPEEEVDPNDIQTGPSAVLVTIITSQEFNSTEMHRTWRNELRVLESLQASYADKNIRFRSFDFAQLDLFEQMQLMVESDVVVGMQSAAMASSVLWTRPEKTMVVEILPKKYQRHEVRNLCQYIGCQYHDFRGGTDIPTASGSTDKVVAAGGFFAFFDPLLRRHLRTQGKAM